MKTNTCKLAGFLVALVMLALLSGCAATTTAVRYQDLKVETKMSDTIFLDPVGPGQRSIFIQIRNTTDKPSFSVENDIAAAVAAKGYRVVNDPNQAHYWLRANVLSVGETDKSALEMSEAAGWGGAAAGAIAGAIIAPSGAEWAGAGIGGLVAGAAEAISGSAVKVHWFAVITDVEIAEQTNQGISQETDTTMQQGTSTVVKQKTASSTTRKRFRTRISSSARQVNLTFPEAEPYLRQGLINSISGLF